MSNKEWFKEWFNENYLNLYSHRDDTDADIQIDLMEKYIPSLKESSILDLCCGEGRHTSLLIERGYRVTGMDLSDTLLRSGKRRFGSIPLIRGDMRQIPGKFDVILSLFTSFGYFESYKENLEVVKGIANGIIGTGYFWIDYFNSSFVASNLVPRSERYLENGTHVLENRKIEDGRVVKKIVMFDESGRESIYHESVALINKPELEEMVRTAGFEIIHSFGDYEGSEWSEDSGRTILCCRKKVL